MSQVHPVARTTPRTRAEMRASSESLGVLAERYNVSDDERTFFAGLGERVAQLRKERGIRGLHAPWFSNRDMSALQLPHESTPVLSGESGQRIAFACFTMRSSFSFSMTLNDG